MPFATLDAAAVARALALVAEGDDVVDAYFEDLLELEVPPAEARLGPRRRVESGLAVRLLRDGRSWTAARDDLAPESFVDALRQIARTVPSALPEPEAGRPGDPFAEPPLDRLRAFEGELERALRGRFLAFPLRVTATWRERVSRVVALRASSAPESERFASVEVETPWGRVGALECELDGAAADRLADRLATRFRARAAGSPAPGRPTLRLSPAATAVALHECVAHALEADLLAASGSPAAAEGREIGAAGLDVLDDPASAPAAVARSVDDEGRPVCRRWLLRDGRVGQPIADLRSAARWPELIPGSGFRADRHGAPLPRTVHLELLAGEHDDAALAGLAEGGIAVAEFSHGGFDPQSGRFWLDAPGGRRLRGGEPADALGAFRVTGRLTDLVGGVVGVGAERVAAGAGWCAKGGQRRAVWATVPAIVIEGLEVRP